MFLFVILFLWRGEASEVRQIRCGSQKVCIHPHKPGKNSYQVRGFETGDTCGKRRIRRSQGETKEGKNETNLNRR